MGYQCWCKRCDSDGLVCRSVDVWRAWSLALKKKLNATDCNWALTGDVMLRLSALVMFMWPHDRVTIWVLRILIFLQGSVFVTLHSLILMNQRINEFGDEVPSPKYLIRPNFIQQLLHLEGVLQQNKAPTVSFFRSMNKIRQYLDCSNLYQLIFNKENVSLLKKI